MKRKHLWISEEAYWILQELKARLRCETYDELFTKLESLILSPRGIGLNQKIAMSTRPYPEPSEEELPSYLRENPWLDILTRRGKDAQA